MSWVDLFVPLAVGFVAGALVGWLAAMLRGRVSGAGDRVELAVAQERLEASRRSQEEQRRFVEESRRQLEDSFQALAASALQGSTEQFLALAEQRFKASQTEASAELEDRRKAIELLVAPLRESLDKLTASTAEMERARTGAYSRLDEQLRVLATATADLTDRTTVLSTTLKGTAGKGRWGEIALRNIVEIAGLTEHVDFEEQPTTEEGTRPDMTVSLPGERVIAIDAKAPVNAFLEAQDATETRARRAALDRHVRELKAHIRTLAARDYASSLTGEIDLVVMFLPSDALLTEAYSREPDLQLAALRSGVLIATPTTLLALLRTVAIYWQQRALAQNAAQIASVAAMLYERAAKFGEDLTGVGRGLQSAIDSYNRAVGSFDHRLMPMAKRLEDMKVAETSRRKLDAPTPVDEPMRLPRDRS